MTGPGLQDPGRQLTRTDPSRTLLRAVTARDGSQVRLALDGDIDLTTERIVRDAAARVPAGPARLTRLSLAVACEGGAHRPGQLLPLCARMPLVGFSSSR